MKYTEKNHIVNYPTVFLNYLKNIITNNNGLIKPTLLQFKCSGVEKNNGIAIIENKFWVKKIEHDKWKNIIEKNEINLIDVKDIKIGYMAGLISPYSGYSNNINIMMMHCEDSYDAFMKLTYND